MRSVQALKQDQDSLARRLHVPISSTCYGAYRNRGQALNLYIPLNCKGLIVSVRAQLKEGKSMAL